MIGKAVAVCAIALFSTSSAQIEGNYTFSSQENFEEFIGAVVGSIGEKYATLVNAKPDFRVLQDADDKFTITRITPDKEVTFTFTLGEPVTADPLGADQPAEFITTLENGALVSKAGDITISRTFRPLGIVLNFTKGPITASRHFDRIGFIEIKTEQKPKN